MKRRIWSAILAVLLLTACTQTEPERTEEPYEYQQPVIPSAHTDGVEPSTESVQPTTEPEITAPESLVAMLEESGLSLQVLTELGCAQLVTVASDGVSAQIDLYLLENHRWHWQEALRCDGFVGKNGTTAQKREGDKATPKGLYTIEEAFCIGDAPQTGLPVFQIIADTYWVDDPASVYYNKRVEGTENKDWSSAEQMSRYSTAYEYGFVIGYNTEAIPHAGSAIFLHVGDHPTAGCIATDRAFVLQYLSLLSEGKNPYILIY